jgi:AcrR family transcriptional regulator
MDGPPGEPVDRRRERSRRTRRRILEAATPLFAERGYGVPLADVAAAAGVSVQGLYATFRNKQTLVAAVLELAVLGDAAPIPPHHQAWFRDLLEATDPKTAIRIWVENTLPIYARVAPLAGMFTSEPAVAAMWANSERLRIEGFREAMTAVAAKGTFRPGIDLDSATDVMFVILGPLVYQAFVRDRAWAPEGWGRWASATLAESLFES